MRKYIYNFTRLELEEYFLSIGEKKFRAQQIWEWLYVKRAQSFDEMTNISKQLIEHLNENFEIMMLEQIKCEISSDGTRKYLFRFSDDKLIETVLMQHNYGNSICVTTQVGCNIGCSFCASGLLKKQRDLSSGEIVAQIMAVQRDLDMSDLRVSHVVVMGIGEPFDNYENFITFIKIINDAKGLAIGSRHITVSTSGIVPKIYQFAEEDFQVNLAISLHSANNETRSQIMKINNVYPLEELKQAIEAYIKKTNRRVTFEYLLLKNVNDSETAAKELAAFAKNKLVYVNLIPYNAVSESGYEQSTKEQVLYFYDLLKKRGINVTVRREHGSDITAACGQLRANNM
ncbi:MAG: 23S rRNA (adenine(2503)-C(2))-methyltransferase RlmN [Culicoidibacterales bacterium]